jgi:signal transduction histidine kinase/ActR/RegA family two-component response regulator
LTNGRRQGTRAHLWHLALIGLITGLLWAGIGLTLWHDHAAAEREAANDTANFARAFEENITRTVQAVDQTLLFVRDAYLHDPEWVTRGSWAGGRAFLDDLHVQMGIADPDGRMLWSNLGPVTSEVSIADREHFQVQQASTADALFISRLVLGRISGKWTIQFTRKLLASDGSFAGVGVASLDPQYLSRFYQSISIGNGVIMLATTSGTVLARAPERVSPLGEALPEEIKSRIHRAIANGTYRAISGADHVDRIFSARQLERYPLIVAVGMATDDVFASYEHNKRVYVAAGTVLSFVSIGAGLIMLRQRVELLASRHALSVTLENMSQGIAMVDAAGNVPVLNQRTIELLGIPPQLVGPKMKYRAILDWQSQSGEYGEESTRSAGFAWVMREGGSPKGDYTYERVRPNGTVLEVRTQSLPDGAFVRTFTDITERKQHEAALAAARARVAHAERMQVLGQLAGGIAHDFNNILQAVQGGATLIAKRAHDAESVRRFSRMVLDATERGSSITRRLLAFARRGELRAEPVEAAPLLSALCEVLNHTLGPNVEVDLRLDDDLPPLLADKGQMETVLVNLANNARDAMPDGGKLTLSATVETVDANAAQPQDLQPGRYVRLRITDTGCGMDEATLARALEPFFSTKPTGQGTGLGLSMAKGFVEQSGGTLSIDSTPGRGTTVHLWLPATTRMDPAPSIPRPAPTSAPRHDGGKKILLVDDEAMVRETLAASLADAGYGVQIAADGAAALEILESEAAIDVLVTDLSMPDIDGLAVIRNARRYRPDLPALLLTGYAGHGAQLAVGGSLTGAFTLVRKPITAAQLADRIEALLAIREPG